MPLDILPYEDQLTKFGFIPSNHVKPNWFPVKIGDIYDARSRSIPGHKRVYRDDSGDTLAVHSDQYRLIPYEVAFDAFDRALGVSGLNLDGMHIATDLTHNGARCFRQYLLPSHKVDLDGDLTALRIIMFNSYDGSLRFSGMAGGYRFVCANMSVIGNDLVKIGVKHVGKDEDNKKIEATISNLVASAATAVKRMESMRKWRDIKINAAEIEKLMEVFPQGSDTLTNNVIAEFSKKDYETLWDFYNVLTSWSTHTESKEHLASVRSKREQRVGAFIECPEWKKVEHV